MFGKHIYLGLESLKKLLCPGSTPCSLGLSGGGMKQEPSSLGGFSKGSFCYNHGSPKVATKVDLPQLLIWKLDPWPLLRHMDKAVLLLFNPQTHLCSFSHDGGEECDTTKRWTFESKRPGFESCLCNLLAVWLRTRAFSLSLKLLSARGKRIPLRVIVKNKSNEITYVK